MVKIGFIAALRSSRSHEVQLSVGLSVCLYYTFWTIKWLSEWKIMHYLSSYLPTHLPTYLHTYLTVVTVVTVVTVGTVVTVVSSDKNHTSPQKIMQPLFFFSLERSAWDLKWHAWQSQKYCLAIVRHHFWDCFQDPNKCAWQLLSIISTHEDCQATLLAGVSIFTWGEWKHSSEFWFLTTQSSEFGCLTT